MKKLKVLDLFSGIGGFSLGLERTGGFETVAFCEIEDFPRKVLKKHWPVVPQFQDVRKLKGSDVGAVDVICGGYPCQPFSTAGKRRGQKDDRHLWPEFNRLVAELRPSWVIGENVAGHISMGLDNVLSDLEGQGYTCRTFVIPACALGAHHRRDRCWTIANTGDVLHPREVDARADCGEASRGEGQDKRQGEMPHGERVWPESGSSSQILAHNESERRAEARQFCAGRSKWPSGPSSTSKNVADPKRVGREQVVSPEPGGKKIQRSANTLEHSSFPRGWEGWLTEPAVGRVADGVPSRVDRLRSLGNAVVPQIPEMIGRAILAAESA